jgi:pimeloyl-ACP methyl ester carboxylesterase
LASKKQNIILLHGALGSCQSFNLLLPIFSSSYKIWTFDFGGHGINSLDIDISASLLRDQLINYILKNEIENATVFGYSMGGYIALMANLKKPEFFKKIITLGTKFNWDEVIAQREIKQLEFIKNLPSIHPFKMQLIETHGQDGYLNCIHQTGRIMLELGQKKILNTETFSLIKSEVLLLVGALDNMVSIDETQNAAKSIQCAEHIVIPETKHPIEKVDAYELLRIIKLFDHSNKKLKP